jgi:hypothetical protein
MSHQQNPPPVLARVRIDFTWRPKATCTVFLIISFMSLSWCSWSRRTAQHRRCSRAGGYATDPTHRLPIMNALAWSPARLIRWAGTIGPMTARLVAALLTTQGYPERAYRSCLGVLRLRTQYPAHNVEMACRQALSRGVASYKSVARILCAGRQRRAMLTAIHRKPAA